jgi:DHA3 family macrolide efflux protein-like MFS transporter
VDTWKKTFVVIWSGQLFSTLSSSVVGYAVVFWLSIETGSAEVLAFSFIAAFLPHLLLGPFTGVLIDRWDRKRVMITADVFIAACTAVMAALFALGEIRIPYIYVLLALRSLGSAFHVPAMQASIPLLAPESQLMRVAGVNQVIHSTSTIAGPALAALLINVFDMTYALLFDVLGAAVAVATLALVRIPRPPKKADAPPPHVLREMMEGLREVYGRPGLLWLFVFVLLVTFFIFPLSALFPLMTTKHFAGGTTQMSLVEVAWGLGMLLGGVLLGVLKQKANKVVLINLTYLALGAVFFASGLLPPTGFALFVGLTLVGGIAGAVYGGAFTVVVQTSVDPAALGRVFSIYGSIMLAPAMFGLLQTGFIADRIGIINVFLITGAALALLGAVSFFVPPIRRMIRDGGTGASLKPTS